MNDDDRRAEQAKADRLRAIREVNAQRLKEHPGDVRYQNTAFLLDYIDSLERDLAQLLRRLRDKYEARKGH